MQNKLKSLYSYQCRDNERGTYRLPLLCKWEQTRCTTVSVVFVKLLLAYLGLFTFYLFIPVYVSNKRLMSHNASPKNRHWFILIT